MEAKLKHLEFIQNIITRMAGNSFLIKGWSLTFVSALVALLGEKDGHHEIAWAVVVPVLVFWALDGFLLSQEKQYRGPYGEVAMFEKWIEECGRDMGVFFEKGAPGKKEGDDAEKAAEGNVP